MKRNYKKKGFASSRRWQLQLQAWLPRIAWISGDGQKNLLQYIRPSTLLQMAMQSLPAGLTCSVSLAISSRTIRGALMRIRSKTNTQLMALSKFGCQGWITRMM